MNYEDEMASALETFVVEGQELLEGMETALLGLEAEPESAETLNAIFRAAHTIKGSSGLFALDHIVHFTHVVETVLDRLRCHEIAVSPNVIAALLPCRDHLSALIAAVAEGDRTETPDQAAKGAALLARLHPFLSDAATGDGPPRPATATASTPATSAAEVSTSARTVHLSVRFGAGCLKNGLDPVCFIRYLSTLGQVVDVTTVSDLLPRAADMDPERCYLAFEVTLSSSSPLEEIDAVFDFVRGDSTIRILTPDSPIEDYVDLVESFGEHAAHIADILVRTGAVSAPDLTEAVRHRSSLSARPAQVPSPTGSPLPAAATAKPGRPGDDKPREARSIRVESSRLDRLVDAVGELVIAGAGAALKASTHHDEALTVALADVMRLVEEVRDSALQLRMVPIGNTFSRFQRVVHDVSADLGKEVDLVISGGETEVDKALVEQIGDPLTHLVRNSLDHGIEAPDHRRTDGKAPRGTLRLNAFHDSGSIVIEVSDDGSGIDRDRVLAKAVQRGLVEPGASLSDKDTYGLLFQPGFSTADSVSDLSGRGVGLDVVKRNVSALRGTIDVDSRLGQGCTMRIRLPLTLAIIDGFLVGIGKATYVVPLDRVIECVVLPATTGDDGCMDLRGEVLPLIRLRTLFSIAGERPERQNVVVVEYAGTKVGLVVDTLLGEFQTVIKPLGRLFGRVQGIGGSTILGNGDVALIIDVSMLVRQFGDRQAPVATDRIEVNA